jgi:hypothetical protein
VATWQPTSKHSNQTLNPPINQPITTNKHNKVETSNQHQPSLKPAGAAWQPASKRNEQTNNQTTNQSINHNKQTQQSANKQ